MPSCKSDYEGRALFRKATGMIRGAQPAIGNVRTIGLTTLVMLAVGFSLARDESLAAPPDGLPLTPPPEAIDDPPAPVESLSLQAEGPRGVFALGPFTSVQVNVNGAGNNIVGDAANEPTIAIDPTNPMRIVIGWRQFDTISSNFRQAGVAYSHDGGQTWTKNTLTPGFFRSDPVLGADNAGNFFYSTLPNLNTLEVFKSIDGGVTWSAPVYAFGGDKQWMTIDRSGGIGDGFIHQIWNVQFTCCPPNDFTRSVNGGATFPTAYALPTPSMKWGTLDVGPTGALYFGGSNLGQSGHLTARCSNCNNGAVAPTFDFVQSVNLGGTTSASAGPNPGGLLGQVWIATDHSTGPTQGNVYMLGSVNPVGTDPLDVMFIRSVDSGVSWSAPIRVNDDPSAATSYQWFGTMSVAPNGRIDVVWNDTTADPTTTLRYSWSMDAGVTWAPSIAVSPSYNRSLGYPQQNKLGDYYQTISDNLGVSVAYAATFNGEQDIYFLRINIDCNENGIPDETDIADCVPNDPTCSDCNGNQTPDECDIASGTSDDIDGNDVPDECEAPSITWDNDPLSPDRTTRSLRFRVQTATTTASNPPQAAIKVTMIDLQNPIPPNEPPFPPPNFGAYESATCTAAGEMNGCARWVGKPGTFHEAQGPPANGPYTAARLQCTPYYHDWITETASNPIAVVGGEIAPSSEYSVQTYGSSCKGLETGCTNVSAPVQMFTRRSGDVEAPYNPPATTTQPDVIDVAQLAYKFRAVTGALPKSICQVQPNLPALNADINALDVVAVVDAVKQKAYPFGGPCPCPSTVTCGSVACSNPTPCVTAFGAGATCVKTCSGGDNDGDPCINDAQGHCPGGTCGAGFCRDRCGRCTP